MENTSFVVKKESTRSLERVGLAGSPVNSNLNYPPNEIKKFSVKMNNVKIASYYCCKNCNEFFDSKEPKELLDNMCKYCYFGFPKPS